LTNSASNPAGGVASSAAQSCPKSRRARSRGCLHQWRPPRHRPSTRRRLGAASVAAVVHHGLPSWLVGSFLGYWWCKRSPSAAVWGLGPGARSWLYRRPPAGLS